MRPNSVGVVDDGREEVDRLHEGGLLVEPEDARVVSRAVVDEDARIVLLRQGTQDLGELARTELARSTGAANALGQAADALALVAHRGS